VAIPIPVMIEISAIPGICGTWDSDALRRPTRRYLELDFHREVRDVMFPPTYEFLRAHQCRYYIAGVCHGAL